MRLRWAALIALLLGCEETPPLPGVDAGFEDASTTDASAPDANSNDRAPPAVQAVSPADGTSGVPINVFISASFNESIQCNAVSATTMTVSAGAASITGELSCAGDTITLVPTAFLVQDIEHVVTVAPEIFDLAGNVLVAPFTWRFTTGSNVDTTPPSNPTITSQVPQTTIEAVLTLSGTKDADANLETRWVVDGIEQHGFREDVPRDGSTTWTLDFPLLDGVNRYILRSRDAASNNSARISILVTRGPNQQPVVPPSVNFYNVTTAPRMVLSGNKQADQAIEIGGVVVVPRNAATTWDWEVTVAPGPNNIEVRAVDAAGARSTPVYADIDYRVPPEVPASAQLRIELELRDMWHLLGDEFRITNCDTEINHYAVEIWIEGPFAFDANGTERCYFDDAELERKYTRYVATVRHHLEFNTTELWTYPAFRVPNYEAALIELGHWANTAQPIPPDADRRDASGNRHDTFRLDLGPPVDGVTAASIRPIHDRNTGRNDDGSALGQWATRPAFYWNMIDRSGQRIRQGAYLINVAIVLDRSSPDQGPGGTTDLGAPSSAPYQWLDVLAADRETCWDRATHDREGQHRAEGILLLDTNTRDVYWSEKGRAEVVDPPHNERAGIRFDGSCDWDGAGPTAFCDPMSVPDDYASAPGCPIPTSSVGASIQYLSTPSGWPRPIHVEYCPGGCP